MHKGGWDQFGEFEIKGFKELWDVLEKLSECDKTIPRCREGCGPLDCKIRECARE